MKNFRIINTETPDQDQLVYFMQGIDIVSNKEPYVKFLTSVAQHHILAYINEELVGWVALIEVNPGTMFLFEWHPFVLPDPNQEEIKQKLIQEAVAVTQNVKIPNLRTFVPVKKPDEERYQTLEELYLSAGMTKTHVQDCMSVQISENNLKNTVIPTEIALTNMEDENRETLSKAYEQVFENSFDDFINSLDELERKYWDLFDENQLPGVAVVLKMKNDIIGFIGTHEEDGVVEIGPVGILPEYRGKKLSNVLLNHVFQKLLELDKTKVYLEVGSRNMIAHNLYFSYGFRKKSEKHGFWMKVL